MPNQSFETEALAELRYMKPGQAHDDLELMESPFLFEETRWGVRQSFIFRDRTTDNLFSCIYETASGDGDYDDLDPANAGNSYVCQQVEPVQVTTTTYVAVK